MSRAGELSSTSRRTNKDRQSFDPAEQTREALVRMRESSGVPTRDDQTAVHGIPGTARLVEVGPTIGMINIDPIMQLEMVVTPHGGAPKPVSKQVIVPVQQLARLKTGAVLPVLLSASDSKGLAILWDRSLTD